MIKALCQRVLRSTPLTEGLMERANYYRRIEMAPNMRARRRVAKRVLRGEGIEIGALHIPQWVPRGAHVRYVDRFDEKAARREYPELRVNPLVVVDIVDDAATLSQIAANSLDFLIANHVVEHLENPLRALEMWLSKLRSGGVIFMAVPDMAHTFDHERAPTSPEHLLGEWRHGHQDGLRAHYEEFGRHVNHLTGSELEAYVEATMGQRANIHFHAWRSSHFLAALEAFGSEHRAQNGADESFVVELCQDDAPEFLIVLRKSGLSKSH